MTRRSWNIEKGQEDFTNWAGAKCSLHSLVYLSSLYLWMKSWTSSTKVVHKPVMALICWDIEDIKAAWTFDAFYRENLYAPATQIKASFPFIYNIGTMYATCRCMRNWLSPLVAVKSQKDSPTIHIACYKKLYLIKAEITEAQCVLYMTVIFI